MHFTNHKWFCPKSKQNIFLNDRFYCPFCTKSLFASAQMKWSCKKITWHLSWNWMCIFVAVFWLNTPLQYVGWKPFCFLEGLHVTHAYWRVSVVSATHLCQYQGTVCLTCEAIWFQIVAIKKVVSGEASPLGAILSRNIWKGKNI